jgi:hypothetical protein
MTLVRYRWIGKSIGMRLNVACHEDLANKRASGNLKDLVYLVGLVDLVQRIGFVKPKTRQTR